MHFCTFASGSSGNCTLVTHNGNNLLIDAGISMRRITAALRGLDLTPGDIAGILITHEHTDHVSALKMLTKYHRLPVYAPEATAAALCRQLPELEAVLTPFAPGAELEIGGVAARSFATPHDTPQSVGYRLEAGSRSFALATDMGCVTKDVYRVLRGVDAAVIEANHDLTMLHTGPYPYHLKQRILSDRGHLSNELCGRLAAALVRDGTQRLVLGHLSRENNTPRLARDTVCDALCAAEIRPGRDMHLSVAPAGEAGEYFAI